MKILAFLTDPPVVFAILEHFRLPHAPPPTRTATSGPLAEESVVTVGSIRDQILTAPSHQFRWRPQKGERSLSDYPRPFGSATVGLGAIVRAEKRRVSMHFESRVPYSLRRRTRGRYPGVRMRLIVGAVLLAPAATACVNPNTLSDPPPNIVFVLLDDVRLDDIVENPFVELPNFARVAQEGASFTNFFTAAPLCSPSRAVFLTGQYPHRNGIVDNRERAEQSHSIRTFPRILHDAGYRSAFIGKWHMGHEDDTPRPGFDRWVSFVGQGTYFDPEMNIDGEYVRESGYMTDILSRYSADFIESTHRSQPFVLYLAHKAVHPEILEGRQRSFPPAPEDGELYKGATLPRTPAWQAPLDGKPALERVTDYTDPRSPAGGTPDTDVLARLRMLSAVDRGLGEILGALEDQGQLDNTVVIVTSDQGFFYGEFGLAQERRLAYEPSIRIPLLVRYPPLISGGQELSTMAANVDVAPTVLDLAGLTPPDDMDGVSIKSVFGGRDFQPRSSFLIEYYTDEVFERIQDMGYRAIRTDRYKYIRYTDLEGMDELYDLVADPYELRNIYDETDPETRVELGRQLDGLLVR